MTFKLIKKQITGNKLKPTEVSVCKTLITFGSGIIDGTKLKKQMYMQVYEDILGFKLGFKITDEKKENGYKVIRTNQASSLSIVSKLITPKIEKGRYNAYKEKNGMWVIDLNTKLNKSENERREITK